MHATDTKQSLSATSLARKWKTVIASFATILDQVSRVNEANWSICVIIFLRLPALPLQIQSYPPKSWHCWHWLYNIDVSYHASTCCTGPSMISLHSRWCSLVDPHHILRINCSTIKYHKLTVHLLSVRIGMVLHWTRVDNHRVVSSYIWRPQKLENNHCSTQSTRSPFLDFYFEYGAAVCQYRI